MIGYAFRFVACCNEVDFALSPRSRLSVSSSFSISLFSSPPPCLGLVVVVAERDSGRRQLEAKTLTCETNDAFVDKKCDPDILLEIDIHVERQFF